MDIETTNELAFLATKDSTRNPSCPNPPHSIQCRATLVPLEFSGAGAWLAGGSSRDDATSTGTNSSEVILDGTATASEVKLPYPTLRHCMVKINETHVALVGGLENELPSPRVHVFDSVSGEWAEMPPMDVPRQGHFCGLAR